MKTYARMEKFCITFEFLSHHQPVGKFLLLILLLLFSTVYNFPLFLFLFSSLLHLPCSLSPINVTHFLCRAVQIFFLIVFLPCLPPQPKHQGTFGFCSTERLFPPENEGDGGNTTNPGSITEAHSPVSPLQALALSTSPSWPDSG